jgi:phosphate transport system ATP-binding protein
MQELNDEYTIELITHNMQQAMRVADLTAFFGVDISHGGRTGYPVEMGKQPRYSKRRANS